LCNLSAFSFEQQTPPENSYDERRQAVLDTSLARAQRSSLKN
jgi:hypothetical protein